MREAAGDYLLWSVAMPALSVAAFQFDGIFLGATMGRQMRNMMIVSVVLYLVLCAVLIPLWGNHGLWFAFAAFMALRGLTLGAVYPAVRRAIPS